jgi:hypothetical protein
MKRILRSRPSPAMVLAFIALLVALGSSAYAQLRIPRNSVGTAQLKRNAVRNSDIFRGAVSTSKLRNSAVTNSKLAANAVTGNKVQDGSLTGADLVLSTLGTVPRAETANTATTATTATTANSVAANGVNTAAIQNDAVTSEKIAQTAVGTEKIGPEAVTGPKIATDAVGASELKGIYAAVSGGTPAAANTFVGATATCNPGDAVLGGGFAWANDGTISTVYSTPEPLANPNQWIVRSRNSVASTLYAWATCLAN